MGSPPSSYPSFLRLGYDHQAAVVIPVFRFLYTVNGPRSFFFLHGIRATKYYALARERANSPASQTDQKEGLRDKAPADGSFFAARHYAFGGFG
jgi:hypothetical protein